MTTESDPFLAAEAAVDRLLEQLDCLRREAEGYADARSSLAEVSQALAASSTSIGRLSEEARSVIGGLQTIGTDQILSEIASLSNEAAGIQSALASLVRTCDDGTVATMRQLEDLQKALAQMGTQARSQRESTQSIIADLQVNAKEQHASTQHALASSARAARLGLVVSAITLAVAIAAALLAAKAAFG